MVSLCVWNIFELSWSEHAHFFEVRGMRAEQKHLGLVLSLLLPQSLIPAQWRGAAGEAGASQAGADKVLTPAGY